MKNEIFDIQIVTEFSSWEIHFSLLWMYTRVYLLIVQRIFSGRNRLKCKACKNKIEIHSVVDPKKKFKSDKCHIIKFEFIGWV